ncbi:MAG TPA: hypothetical protein VNG31_02660 [Candidatus Baltobacteraceae bacterium]|nr:hypothetical protein [Candidatus Baltobacteraceae bacterium]
MIRFALLLAITLSVVAAVCPVGAVADAPSSWNNPFCKGSVYVIPWDGAVDAPSRSRSTDRYAVELEADGKTDVTATITLISLSGAYSVDVSHRDLLRESGSDRFYAEPVLVKFKKPVALRYAYVDAIGVDGAAPASCPTVPETVAPLAADRLADAPRLGTDVAATGAKYLQALPPLSCGHVYTPPVPPNNPSAQLLIGNAGYGGRPLTARVHIFIDSNGLPAEVLLDKSSGVTAYDDVVVGAAQHTRYTPATFLCTPVVSDFSYELEWRP